MKLIDNAKREFHRLWTIRLSIAFSVFTAVSALIDSHASIFNPWALVGMTIIVNGFLIPLTRLAKQAEPEPPKTEEPPK